MNSASDAGKTEAGAQGNSLEKSKSDSRLNQFAENTLHSADPNDEELIHRSASNQSVGRQSPSKKKAKSISRLSELDKDVSNWYKDMSESLIYRFVNTDQCLRHWPAIILRSGHSAEHQEAQGKSQGTIYKEPQETET